MSTRATRPWQRVNQTWVEAARRISPRLLGELLAVTGEATERYLASLEPLAVEEGVAAVDQRDPAGRGPGRRLDLG